MLTTSVFIPSTMMTYATVEIDRKLFLKHCHKIKHNIVINLNDVIQFDSAGLALLIEVKRICKQNNIICAIKNHPQIVKDLAIFYSVNSII